MLSEYVIDRLAEYFECSVDELQINGQYVTLPDGREYLCCENDDEADEYAIESVKNLYDDIGITGMHLDYIGGLDSFVDTDWFEAALMESMGYYAEDIKTESMPSDDNPDRNRLEAEMEEAGCDTVEEFVAHLVDNAGDPVEWFQWTFGKDEFENVVKENELIDVDKLAQAIIDYDGRGSILASYDGIELDEDDFYLYRTN